MTTKKTPRRAKSAKGAEAQAPAEAPPQAAPKKPRRTRKAPASAAGLRVFIDFPQEGELVRPGHYTVRVGTVPAAGLVQVCVDGGDWIECREGAGYWWFDWTGYEPGPHRIEARAHGGDGGPSGSAIRRCSVEVLAEEAAGGPAPS